MNERIRPRARGDRFLRAAERQRAEEMLAEAISTLAEAESAGGGPFYTEEEVRAIVSRAVEDFYYEEEDVGDGYRIIIGEDGWPKTVRDERGDAR